MATYKYDKTTGELTKIAGGTLYADLPIGSWIKNDMSSLPTGFLKAGDTISPTEYPELYAKYGSTVPYKADKSELSDYSQPITFEQITAGYTMPYDGVMNIGANSTSGSTIAYISINNSRIVNIGAASYTGSFVEFRKGDVVRAHDITTNNYILKVAYYMKSLIVKAKNVGVPTNFSDAIQRAIDTALQEYPKRYKVDGYILNGDVIRGYGRANVMLYANGQAVIEYACRVTTANTASNVFGWGISPKIISQINSSIPLITPEAGGTMMCYRTGSDVGVLYPQQDLVHFCGTHNTVQYLADMYWQLARLYSVGTAPGGWPTSQFPLDSYIQGTCYGTFSV